MKTFTGELRWHQEDLIINSVISLNLYLIYLFYPTSHNESVFLQQPCLWNAPLQSTAAAAIRKKKKKSYKFKVQLSFLFLKTWQPAVIPPHQSAGCLTSSTDPGNAALKLLGSITKRVSGAQRRKKKHGPHSQAVDTPQIQPSSRYVWEKPFFIYFYLPLLLEGVGVLLKGTSASWCRAPNICISPSSSLLHWSRFKSVKSWLLRTNRLIRASHTSSNDLYELL